MGKHCGISLPQILHFILDRPSRAQAWICGIVHFDDAPQVALLIRRSLAHEADFPWKLREFPLDVEAEKLQPRGCINRSPEATWPRQASVLRQQNSGPEARTIAVPAGLDRPRVCLIYVSPELQIAPANP